MHLCNQIVGDESTPVAIKDLDAQLAVQIVDWQGEGLCVAVRALQRVKHMAVCCSVRCRSSSFDVSSCARAYLERLFEQLSPSPRPLECTCITMESKKQKNTSCQAGLRVLKMTCDVAERRGLTGLPSGSSNDNTI